MKLWGKVYRDHRISDQYILQLSRERIPSGDDWAEALTQICKQLDLERPVMLPKHERELRNFGLTAFRRDDFMETVSFDRFTVEVIPEDKKKTDR